MFNIQNQLIMNIKDVPIDKVVFRIDGIPYMVSEDKPQKGDRVLDLDDYAHGIHDGERAGFISVRDGWAICGVRPDRVKKLVTKVDLLIR